MQPDGAIEKILRVNLTAQFWTCNAFLPAMIPGNKGHVIDIAPALYCSLCSGASAQH